MKVGVIRTALFGLGLLSTTNAYALETILITDWQTRYAASTSDEAACQLCHVNPNGNSPWNAYGWAIRDRIQSGFSVDQALAAVEGDNSDSDTGANSNVSEITAGTQPGWAVGNVNTHYFADGSTLGNQPPPINLPAGIFIDPGSDATPVPNPDPVSDIPRGNITIKLETIASGLNAPVLVRANPNDNFLYVVEQRGLIKRVDPLSGVITPFLDFSAQLVPARAGFDERGLLGFAFHPDYANNNKVYTYISEPDNGTPDFTTMPGGVDPDHQAVIAEWVVENPQSSPSATDERELLRIDQPQFNHNGGSIEFGPDNNNLLYIALGDGGSANDEGDGHGADGNGRNPFNPLGAILRIDVDGDDSNNGEYGIPNAPSNRNPFVGFPELDEIYAYGFRNPYRFSIDDLGGGDFNLYVGDVGQGDIEEVDIISSDAPGGNYGWNYKEGSFFFYTDSVICSGESSCVSVDPPEGVALPNFQEPIAEYDHNEGVSVVGGHVYRGTEIEELDGLYVFGEWSQNFGLPQGRLFYLDESNTLREFNYEAPTDMYITGIGKSNNNELYVVGNLDFDPLGSSGMLKKITLGSDELCVPIKANNGNIAVICL